MTLETGLGTIQGNERENSYEFLGIRYAKANRFSYAELVDSFDGTYDATHYGDACTQKRTYFEHLEIPERMFYHREFRDGIQFSYSEDCLNLNIYTPKEKGNYPVVIYIHGGGFDSGANSESCFDGDCYAKRGIVSVFIQYRVGVFGYLTNEELFHKDGKDGNYGLDDQYKAVLWVKKHIQNFCGDPENITLMGQSAGAMSIQYLCSNQKYKGLFQRAIMMSGAGKFPKFSLPKPAAQQREYWDQVIELAGCKNIEEFQKIDAKKIFEALEIQKSRRKDNTYHTMPVIDGDLIDKPIDEAILNPLPIDYLIGFTNNDMYTILMEMISMKFGNRNNAYLYYFDIDAKGDKNLAFHSADLRYAFGTLGRSWRPYDEYDHKISEMMIDQFSQFIKTGNPNRENLPLWERKKGKALCISKTVKMGKPRKMTLLINTLKGDPK